MGSQSEGSELGSDRPLRIGVVLEQPLEVGGGFQQSLNDVLWLREWAKSTGNEVIVFTPHSGSVAQLQTLNIEARRLKPGLFDRIALFAKYTGSLDLLQRFLKVRAPMEKRLMKDGIDVVYFTTPSVWHMLLFKLPFIITIFDICHRDAPEFDEVREFGHFERRESLFASASTKAVLVIANSEELIEDLRRCYGLNPQRAVRIPFSPSVYVTRSATNSSSADADVLRKYGLQPGYLFYPAQFWSHKNHATLLAAAALLRDRGSTYRVVFCGSDRGTREQVNDLIAHHGISDQVSIIGFVDSEELGALYRGATALVMPSYFGPANLPPLEAWAVGIPVIYPEAFKSFVGDAAILFDYDDPGSLAEAVVRAGEPEVRLSLSKTGEARLQHFAEQIEAGRRQLADQMKRLKFRRTGLN
jgi:glycosyltransferase involved in cell wall biosynthesis